MNRCFVSVFSAVSLVAAVGCGGGKGDVSGEVMVNDKPLVAGRIYFFYQKGNQRVIESPIEEGKFSFKNVPTGPVKVSVESFSKVVNPGIAPPKDSQAMSKDFSGQFQNRGARKPSQVIHVRFNSPETSELDYEVIKGDQTQNFSVTPP